ncbi:MAG TPA: hypothetical protein VM347_23600 [Nonomuraea sp.]|nr:hypothetical protein [Nonomuraea sp.]
MERARQLVGEMLVYCFVVVLRTVVWALLGRLRYLGLSLALFGGLVVLVIFWL